MPAGSEYARRMLAKGLIPGDFEKEDLVQLLEDVVEKYDKEHARLKTTRQKLTLMKQKLVRLKAIVKYQRERIIELYDGKPVTQV